MKNSEYAATVREALAAELEELYREICKAAEPLTDEQLWKRPLTQSNSVGHLILHLTGNLNHFVGAQLGNSGYVRDREREFTEAQLPARPELFARFADAVATFRRVVGGLSVEQLQATHPTAKFGNVTRTLVHLVAHFAVHRGQISYLVRLV